MSKISDHPIWSMVAATLIATGIIYVIRYIPTLFSLFRRVFWNVAIWLSYDISIPRWLIFFFVLYVSTHIIVHVTRTINKNKYKNGKKSKEIDYTEDIFWDVVWRWQYGFDKSVNNIIPFCPICDMQLQPTIFQREPFNPKIKWGYNCDNCYDFSQQIDIDPNDLDDFIIRAIQRKLRTGEWKSVTKEDAID